MIRPFLIVMALVLSLSPGYAQQQAPTAESILKTAYDQAAREDKKVMVIFHASWCGWCRKLDAAMQDPSCKSFFDDNFVTTHLTVKERPNNRHLENPGAMELLTQYKGDKGGIPFFLIFDADGQFVADSKFRTPDNPEGDNMGCPATDEEVAAFLALLKQTTKLKDSELAVIGERFKKNRS